MSKISQVIFIATVLLIVSSTLFNPALVVSGSGLILLTGLVYAYIVHVREIVRNQLFEEKAEQRQYHGGDAET